MALLICSITPEWSLSPLFIPSPFVYNVVMELDFYKIHLNGHDFILVNGFRQPLPGEDHMGAVIRRMCNRGMGVGARGAVLLYPGEEHQGRVVYYDGSGEEAPVPLDALLCTSRYAFDFGLADRGTTVLENRGDALSVQCLDGIHFRHSLEVPGTVTGEPILKADDADLSVRVRVGPRSLSCKPLRFRTTLIAIYADPRVFSENTVIDGLAGELEIEEEQYSAVGYQVYTRDELTIFFRDPGEGDAVEGAAAAASAAVIGGFCDRDVVVHYRGGKFLYEWNETDGRVFITGTPLYVFTGNYEVDENVSEEEY
jgi:diaminopimelate epimerase